MDIVALLAVGVALGLALGLFGGGGGILAVLLLLAALSAHDRYVAPQRLMTERARPAR